MGLDKQSNNIMETIYSWLLEEEIIISKDDCGKLAGVLSHINYHSQEYINHINDLVKLIENKNKERIGDVLIEMQTEINNLAWEISEGQKLLDKAVSNFFEKN